MIELMIERLTRLGLPLSIALSLAADFPWHDLQGHAHWQNVAWIPFVSPPVRPLDISLNVMLFVPFGWFARQPHDSTRRAFARSAFIALIVSVIGEWTQVYSHTRIPSATDVVSNAAGAVAGTSFALYARPRAVLKAILHLGLVTLSLCVAPDDARAQGPENVAVVINDNSAASQRIGEYYARKRGIPASNIFHIKSPDTETIDRTTYGERIERPVGDALLRLGFEDRILYIVLTKGIPLRIAGSEGQGGTVSSVDSELTLLYRRLTGSAAPVAGWIDNPYFLGSRSVEDAALFTHRALDIYLVTRLDAFSIEEALALVDRALTPSRDGKIVLDEKRTLIDRGGDSWLRAASTELQRLGHGDRVLLESSRRVATDVSPAIGYYSWGSNDPANQLRRLRIGFVPGSIAATFVSSDGRTFNEPPAEWLPGIAEGTRAFAGSPQSLIGDLLRDGVTGAAGHVTEPFLQSTIRPQILFPAYVSGFNLAESFYLAMPYLSWQTIVIGDPLCAPFPRKALSHADIEGPLDSQTELPAFFSPRRLARAARLAPRSRSEVIALLVKAETRLHRGDVDGARQALEMATSADNTLMGAELQLGNLYQQAGLFDDAAKRYRRVLTMRNDHVLALNNLAYVLAVNQKLPAEALPLAKKAYALAPRSASVIDTLAWVQHLLGQDKSASLLITEALRRAPKNAELQLHAAIVFAAAEDPRRAAGALSAALLLDPSLETRDDARSLRQRLTAEGWFK